MTDFVIAAPETPSVKVEGTDSRFPVRRIFCVGRNYADHAREMGSDPDREPPFFFSKPADTVVDSGSVVPHPPLTRDLHHEVELVIAIGTGGFDIDRDDALAHVWGYGVGIDLTRRDLQSVAKSQGRPWDWAKGFDQSAPCSAIMPVKDGKHPSQGRIWLTVNGAVRQEGNLSDLIWPIPDIISICSQSVELQPGDLIYTGTPAGVTTLVPGDVVKAGVDGIGEIEITIGNAI